MREISIVVTRQLNPVDINSIDSDGVRMNQTSAYLTGKNAGFRLIG